MREMLKEMLRIYTPLTNLDWMNYRLVRSQVTFHHIRKKCDGGKRKITNGALLMPQAHEYLHIIEYKDLKIYEAINKILKIINTQLHEPDLEQRNIIEYLLLEFEDKYRNELNSKGNILIKEKYLKRW